MNFRTELDIVPSEWKIDHSSHILSVGSCFADNIAAWLARSGFDVTANPFGEQFNPLSVCAAIERMASAEEFTESDLNRGGEMWFSYMFHGSFERCSAAEALDAMNAALRKGSEALVKADTVILTFGTAWVYTVDGRVAANCHKQPSRLFTRRRLSVEEITTACRKLVEGPLKGKRLIVSVSPVRHLGDGLTENSLSKAILRVAVAEFAESCADACYFPSFELLTDDLRDYRFYAADMTHPSAEAVKYIWEKFCRTFMVPRTIETAERFISLVEALNHRPLHPHSAAYADFRDTTARKIEQLREEFPDACFDCLQTPRE